MDNFTHSLAGWALGQTGLKTKSRKGLAALILGANMPDIDVFLGWAPWAPLATHRGFTHGIGGVALMPPILAGLLWLLDRWQLSRGKPFKSGLSMHFRWLVALAYLGTLTHPLLDMQTTYAVQLFAPFDSRWYHTETLFIIDVWIWSGLSFAIWLSRRREKLGGDWRKPAIAGLMGACAYIGLNGAISLMAQHALVTNLAGPKPDIVIASEEPVLFWRRNVIWRQGRTVGAVEYDPLMSVSRVDRDRVRIADNMNEPLVLKARRRPDVIRFLRWSFMPFAMVQERGCEATVSFGDARFGISTRRFGMTNSVKLPVNAPDCLGKPVQ
jgi:inner membrane protein